VALFPKEQEGALSAKGIYMLCVCAFVLARRCPIRFKKYGCAQKIVVHEIGTLIF
jgi:hypothetical protein